MERGGYSGRGAGGHRGGRGGRSGRGGRGGGNQQYHQYQQQQQQQQHHHQRQYQSQGQWRDSSYGANQPTPWRPRAQVDLSLGGASPGGQESTRGAHGGGGRGRGRWLPNRGGVGPSASTTPPSDPIESLHSEMQSVKLSDHLPSSSSVGEKTDKMVPVKRPDGGGTLAIRHINLRVNHFPVTFNPQSIIKHYDVDIKQEGAPKNGRPGRISKSNLCMIRNKLFTDNPTQFPLSMTAYDGEKNIFSADSLPTGVFKVDFSEGEDMKSRRYTITIKLVNELKLCKLKDYLTGNLFSIPRDILQGMDVVMKENSTRRMIFAGRSFHSPDASYQDDLGFGITASRGYIHSLKPTSQGLALCLDYCLLAFRKRLPVIKFLEEHIPGFHIDQFWSFRAAVEAALRNLKVTVTHRITKQKYTIAGLTRDSAVNTSFDVEDPVGSGALRKVGVVDYFRKKYGKDIVYKNIPCLDVGKNNRKNYVPMEFCVLVEGQIYPKDQLDEEAALMLKHKSLAKPGDRERMICQMVRSADGPCGGDVARNFQIEVSKNMTPVMGRVIGPPELRLGARRGEVIKITVDKEKCQWNLVNCGVVEGKRVERWAVLDFSASERNSLNPNQFIPKLIARCRSLGIYIEDPLFCEPAGMRMLSNIGALHGLLENITTRASKYNGGCPQILLCVMSRKDNGYKFLKWISETKIGVVTQCCLSKHANMGRDQYLANLALKINAKLGGSNVELIDRLPYFNRDDHVMFVGADVNHPAAQNRTSPSIAAVVATVNWPAANRYAARVCAQYHRKEQIINFGNMCMELVNTYARLNGVKPNKIVVFRDGVSEGQFDMVLNEEFIDLKRVFQTANYFPTVTVIVAQKRHQTRLFPENRNDGGSTGNVPPGTVVDTKIVHPHDYDFYLCSHYGGLGTSKPTHYYVLWDEHGFSSDQLQKLIYNLCFTFARCTKPVSLVPPVYYADLVAYRGRLYNEAMDGHSRYPASAKASSSALSSVSHVKYQLHADLEDIMYFV